VTQAGAEPVTQNIRFKPRLAVNDLQGTLVAVRNTLPATVALLLVDLNYVSLQF